jgi:hypothetical protein
MITIPQLIKLGFKEVQPRFYELDFSYDWFRLKKNNSILDVTIEYDCNNNFTLQYIEINGEKLEGHFIGIKELKFLIKLL